MEYNDRWFTFTFQEAADYPARELLDMMGEMTGVYDPRFYVMRAVEHDRIVIYCSDDTERDNHFARLDDWIAGSLEEFGDPDGDPYEYPLIFHDHVEFLMDRINIAAEDEEAWNRSPEHAGKPDCVVEGPDSDNPATTNIDFNVWVCNAPRFFDEDAAYEYVKRKLVIRPPEGDEKFGQIVDYFPHDEE